MKLTQITNPVALRLDTTVGTRIFAGDAMIHGDTGLRNITDMIPPQISGRTLSVQRYGNMVFLRLNAISADVDTPTSFTLPNGFKPSTNGTFRKETRNGYVDLTYSGRIDIVPNTTVSITAQIIYVTGDSWPATLPGLPV